MRHAKIPRQSTVGNHSGIAAPPYATLRWLTIGGIQASIPIIHRGHLPAFIRRLRRLQARQVVAWIELPRGTLR